MTTGPRTSHVFLAAFFASFVGGGLGAGVVVSYVASDMKNTAGAAAADALRRSEGERRRAEEEAAKRRADDAEAKRRAEEDRRRAEEQRRREDEEARRRSEPERHPGAITCDHALPQFKSVFSHETDCYFLLRAFRVALDSQTDGGAESNWTNTRTGTSGTMKILETTRLADGTMCRRFEQTVTVKGRKTSATGKACFRDNSWRIET